MVARWHGVRVGVLALLTLIASAVFLASPAAAGGFSCNFTVSPTVLGPDGGRVTITGVAPGSSVVRVFADQDLVAIANSDPVTGEFSASFDVTESVEVAVGVDDYPLTPCVGVGDNTIAGAGTGRGRGNLPRTGGSDTQEYVLAGFALVALGTVMVAGARRWATIRGR